MTELQTRLDLGCPFHWPKNETPVASTSTSHLVPENWIRDRYNETLWLGEHHSPLSAFLSHVTHLQHKGSAQNTAEALRPLIRSRAQIRQRFSSMPDGTSEDPDRTGGWSDKAKLVACLEGRIDHNDYEASERSIVSNALRSGAAKVVAKELQESKKSGIGSFGKLWIDAIETRELQLQVMVLLCLLRLNAENPDLFKVNKSIAKDEENGTSPSSVKRRKRKAEKSQRWTGVGSIFPWQMGKPMTSTSSKYASSSSESLSDPEVLSKQFEGMIDFLCLRVATTNISLSTEQDGSNEEEVSKRAEMNTPESPTSQSSVTPRKVPQTPGESPAALARKRQAAGHAIVIPPFGSEGRRKESRDERDVLQWFCNLIESHFAKTLPRQCGTLGSRCFISTAATPAKRSLSSRQNDSRTNTNDSRAKSADSRTTESVGALQRSLLREDFQRTQSFAAAKQKSTWDAREVSVRKRWERSQSVGSSISAVDRQEIRQPSKQPVEQPVQVIAFDTPSKPRPSAVFGMAFSDW